MTIPAASTSRRQSLQPALADGQTIKCIGLGGVGHVVARHGAVFLAALADAQGCNARLVLADGDDFTPSNATRVLFPRLGNKAAVLREELLARLGASRLCLDAVETYVTRENIARLVHEGDIVLLAVDNHATRKLVSDFCAGEDGWPGLADVCLISGGNDGAGPDSTGRIRRGTFGNCQVFVRRSGRSLCPSLTAHHEEIRAPADRRPDDQDCLEAVASTQQNLLANLMAAASMLNALWLHLCGDEALHYSELAFDIAEGLMRPVHPYLSSSTSS